MSGLTDLNEILATLTPRQMPGRFVFVTTGQSVPARAMVAEAEGRSLVVTEQDAAAHGLGHDGVFGWITLEVHSSLAAVGLTAAVAAALAAEQISCNVIAGRHHDHLLVPIERVTDALVVLHRLAGRPADAFAPADQRSAAT